MKNKRVVDITIEELADFLMPQIKKAIMDSVEKTMKDLHDQDMSDKLFTLNYLVKKKWLGGRDRIITLISQGKLKRAADGRIPYSNIKELMYVNTEKEA